MIKLLHVEDDADIREITKMALELSGGFEIMQCATGQDALDIVADFQPDVLLLDMMMPGMTGRQTLDHLRQKPGLEDVPAIFMTARTQPNEMDELRQIGASGVIGKPFDPMSLADQIRSVLE